MMDEPTELGTVVVDEHGETWVLAFEGLDYPWVNATDQTGVCWCWNGIDHPVLIHKGAVPQTEEPLLFGSVVRDATGETHTRVGHPVWAWVDPHGSKRVWSYLTQPVKILFRGVET